MTGTSTTRVKIGALLMALTVVLSAGTAVAFTSAGAASQVSTVAQQDDDESSSVATAEDVEAERIEMQNVEVSDLTFQLDEAEGTEDAVREGFASALGDNVEGFDAESVEIENVEAASISIEDGTVTIDAEIESVSIEGAEADSVTWDRSNGNVAEEMLLGGSLTFESLSIEGLSVGTLMVDTGAAAPAEPPENDTTEEEEETTTEEEEETTTEEEETTTEEEEETTTEEEEETTTEEEETTTEEEEETTTEEEETTTEEEEETTTEETTTEETTTEETTTEETTTEETTTTVAPGDDDEDENGVGVGDGDATNGNDTTANGDDTTANGNDTTANGNDTTANGDDMTANGANGNDTDAEETASVTFENQTSNGTAVNVSSVTLPEDGYVTIHNDSLLEGEITGSVIGVSEYLEAGTYENVTVTLFNVSGADFGETTTLEEDQSLIAMPHVEDSDNETYDFVSSDGVDDGPFTADGVAVTERAFVTVEMNETTANETETEAAT